MNSPMIQFRATNGLGEALESRGEAGGPTARRDLGRYYAALESALRTVELSEPEWNLLRELLNSTVIDYHLAEMLWAEVEDAQIAARLRVLPPFTRLAICDAVERWWQAQA